MDPTFSPGSRNGGIIPPGNRDYFVYPVALGSLAAAAIATVQTQISADSDFYLTAMTYFSELAGAAQTDSTRVIPLLTVQFTDTGSGRQLFNQAAPLHAIAGDGTRPYRLIHPRLFRRSTTIQTQATNVSAATTYTTTFICLIGFKLYGAPAPQL